MTKKTAYLLVFFQFLWIGLIFILGNFIAKDIYLLALEMIGVAFGLYSIYIMKLGNFNIAPIPKENGNMRVSGPYKIIRHPMYDAVLITLLPLIIEDFTYIKLSIWLALLLTFVLKMNYEEKELKMHYVGYSEYCLKTWKLVPFVY